MENIKNNNENFCSKTGKKLNEVCPSCLIKILIPYECEYGHCPDKKLHILESEKEEEKTKNGGSEMEDLIKIAEEQIEILKEKQNPYGDDVVINASREIREWCYSIERCRALIQRDKAIQEMKEQMKEIKPIKNMDIEEVVTELSESIKQATEKFNVRNDKEIDIEKCAKHISDSIEKKLVNLKDIPTEELIDELAMREEIEFITKG